MLQKDYILMIIHVQLIFKVIVITHFRPLVSARIFKIFYLTELSTSNVLISAHILRNHFRVCVCGGVGGSQGHDCLDYAAWEGPRILQNLIK